MAVNGLLLTLTEDEMLAKETLLELGLRKDIELGERTARWQPLVVDAKGIRQSHEVHEWLSALPGVVMVDVVFSSVERSEEEQNSKQSTFKDPNLT